MNRWNQFDPPEFKFICVDCQHKFNSPVKFQCPECKSPDYWPTDEFYENERINAEADIREEERLLEDMDRKDENLS